MYVLEVFLQLTLFLKLFGNMGNWFSSANSQRKLVESDGEVNNNVVIQEGMAPGTSNYGFEIMVISAIICAVKLFEFAVFLYKNHTKLIKKSYDREIRLGDTTRGN